jgi:xanthine dehydrogenase accessory factor
MNSMDVDVVGTAIDWLRDGRGATLGTVVHTWGSSPRPPGSLMVIRDDGQVVGSLSGGCIEDDLIDRVRRGELGGRLPQATLYGKTAEEARRFGLPCGGSVQIVLEPLHAGSRLDELLHEVEHHRVVRRTLTMGTGAVHLETADEGDTVRFDGQTLRTVHGPRLRLVLIGAGQASHYLAEMAAMLDYRVIVCDPRVEYHEGWVGDGNIALSREMPDDLVIALKLDGNSAVVAMTHDPKLDDLALMEALKTPAFYVAALGSRRNNDARRQRLREFDVSEEQAAALHGPAGLNLGGRTPPEIALAILAEMTALRHGRPLNAALADWSGSEAVCRAAA